MPVYNTTIFFAGRAEGWSESHQLNTTLSKPIDCFPLMEQLAQLRANLLGLPYLVIGFRVSQYTIDGLTKAPRAVKISKKTFVQSATCQTGDAEPGAVALLMNGETAAGPETNITFLGAPSDAGVNQGGQVQGAAGNIRGNWVQYAQFLQNPGVGSQFGWGKSNSGQPIKINAITQNVDGTVHFVLNNPAQFVAPFGKQFPARVKQVNQGKSVLNGALNVESTAANACDSVDIIAFANAQNGGKMRLYPPIRPFTAYSVLTLQDAVGNHKRGRPFGSRRGRAPARLRG